MRARPFLDQDADRWDEFCASAPMATFLHTRRFLSYHGDRFRDVSLIIEDDSGTWLGVLPAAVAADRTTAISHPGATFGGFVHQGRLLGEAMIEALVCACRHFSSMGILRFRYKAIPRIYHRRPSDDDLYALFRLNAERTRCDLSSAIDLAERGPIAERRRRGTRKAARHGVMVDFDDEALAGFWPVLIHNLDDRHGAQPVHSLAEMEQLKQRFPENIRLVTARVNGDIVGGTVLFCSSRTVHAQYISSSASGRAVGALDAVFEHVIRWAADGGHRYFNFGVSNEDSGKILNTGLYRFKCEFGASGVAHELYDIDLTRSPPCP